MSHELSKSVVPPVKPGTRRRWTDEMRAEVAGYYEQYGYKATAQRYHINARGLAKIRESGVTPSKPNGNGSTPRQSYILARKLKDAVSERLKTGFELGDVEIYATLLTRQLLE